MHDLLIRNASIVDGSGAPAFAGDVAVSGGRIAAVGKVDGTAHRTIEADGRTLTPGFVDIHTHYDGQASWDGMMAPSSFNGVTSIAMGNCGVGFAPARTDYHEQLIALLEGVEDIPGTALSEGLTWDWESFPEYLDAIERRSYTVDLGAHMPHAALRTYVMGPRGADHEQHPDADEVARMEALTYEALCAGAVGFSTSRTIAHRSRDGGLIGTLAAEENELAFAARALRRAGRGVIQLISDAYMTDDDAFADAEMALIRELAETSGRPLSFSLQQSGRAPDRWRQLLDRAAGMAREGLPVRVQVAPRPVGLILGLTASVNPLMFTPGMIEIEAMPLRERVAALRDPARKARILKEHTQSNADPFYAGRQYGYANMFRMNDPVDYEPDPESSLAAEAGRMGIDPAAHVYDALLEEEGLRLIYSPALNYVEGNLGVVYEMMRSPQALFGLSDGGAHCGSICDASFPTTTLGLWRKGNKAGQTLPVEMLVHGYTRRNAAHLGWLDRGLVKPGYLADLNLVDLDALALSPPRAVADLPAGGSRLLQTPRGYHYTIKTGVVTFESGEPTGEMPGRLLRGEQPEGRAA